MLSKAKSPKGSSKKQMSEFLRKFVEDNAFNSCIGSGDDGFYVQQVWDYVEKQIPFWNDFEKQVREDESKKWTQKLQELILDLQNNTGCPYCARMLTESHFCKRCNERVAVELSYDGLIEEELEKLIKEVEK